LPSKPSPPPPSAKARSPGAAARGPGAPDRAGEGAGEALLAYQRVEVREGEALGGEVELQARLGEVKVGHLPLELHRAAPEPEVEPLQIDRLSSVVDHALRADRRGTGRAQRPVERDAPHAHASPEPIDPGAHIRADDAEDRRAVGAVGEARVGQSNRGKIELYRQARPQLAGDRRRLGAPEHPVQVHHAVGAHVEVEHEAIHAGPLGDHPPPEEGRRGEVQPQGAKARDHTPFGVAQGQVAHLPAVPEVGAKTSDPEGSLGELTHHRALSGGAQEVVAPWSSQPGEPHRRAHASGTGEAHAREQREPAQPAPARARGRRGAQKASPIPKKIWIAQGVPP
jgi:hypothetical protein